MEGKGQSRSHNGHRAEPRLNPGLQSPPAQSSHRSWDSSLDQHKLNSPCNGPYVEVVKGPLKLISSHRSPGVAWQPAPSSKWPLVRSVVVELSGLPPFTSVHLSLSINETSFPAPPLQEDPLLWSTIINLPGNRKDSQEPMWQGTPGNKALPMHSSSNIPQKWQKLLLWMVLLSDAHSYLPPLPSPPPILTMVFWNSLGEIKWAQEM